MRQIISFLRYGILFLGNLFLLLFLHSYFNFILLIVLLAMPFLSAGCAFLALHSLEISFEGTKERLELGDPFLLKITVRNNSIIPLLNVWLTLTMENKFFEIKGTHRLNIPAFVVRKNEIKYELSSKYLGVISAQASEIMVMDWLGFFRFRKKISLLKEYVVIPDSHLSVEPESAAMEAGMTEAEENPKKGYDFSEVTDVREYQPGDRLQNIHWKLTAKKDELMVKERESLSSNRLLVFVELLQDEGMVLNDILMAAYGMARHLLDNQISFELKYWSVRTQELKAVTILNISELDDWMEQIYYETAYREDGLGRKVMRQLFLESNFLVISKAGSMQGAVVFSYKQSVEGRICEA